MTLRGSHPSYIPSRLKSGRTPCLGTLTIGISLRLRFRRKLSDAWVSLRKSNTQLQKILNSRKSSIDQEERMDSQKRTFIEHFRTIESISFLFAIGTILMENQFWWFVLFTYIAIVAQLAISIADKKAGKGRFVTGILFTIALLIFTFGIVLGKANIEMNASWSPGNFLNGTDIHGLAWHSDWSELLVSVQNNDKESNVRDFDAEFVVSDGVAGLRQFDGSPCTLVPSGNHPIQVVGGDASGRETLLKTVPIGQHYRLLCDRIPAKTSISLIIAVMNVNGAHSEGGETVGGPKKKPAFEIHSKFKIGMRPYSQNKVEP